jgi:proteasome accessory factor A
LRQTLRSQTGKTLTAIQVQSEYLLAAQKNLSGEDPETDWILSQWEEVLALLETDRSKLKDRVDWITKEWLLNTFCDEEKISKTDPWLVSLDLEYHNLDPERGLYTALEAEGKIQRLTTDQEIQEALIFPPEGTRARIRGLCIRKFKDQIQSIQWEKISFKNGWHKPVLNMERLLDPREINEWHTQLEAASSWKEAMNVLSSLKNRIHLKN